jgi:hypothetical protein
MTILTLIFATILLSLLYSYSRILTYNKELEELNELKISFDDMDPIAGAEKNKKRLVLTYNDSFQLRKNTVLLKKTIKQMTEEKFGTVLLNLHLHKVISRLSVNNKAKFVVSEKDNRNAFEERLTKIVHFNDKYTDYMSELLSKRMKYILNNLE